jgi:hypothetical protein
MATDKLYARIRKDDVILREHFDSVKQSDHPYEVRRLLEKAIKIERKEKEILEGIEIQVGQDS